MTLSTTPNLEPNQELNEISKLLKPYSKKIIKNGLLLSRVSQPQQDSISYSKMSTWLDDLARFITLTSTFSKSYMSKPQHINMKKELQSTNLELVGHIQLLGQLLKSEETLIPELIEEKILPLMNIWQKRIIPNVQHVIQQLQIKS